MRRGPRSRILVTLILFGAACGRAPEPATAPRLEDSPAPSAAAPAPGERESPTDLDALEHELTLSEERLSQHLSRREQALEIAGLERESRSEAKKSREPTSKGASGGAEFSRPPPPAAARPARKRADDARAADAAPQEGAPAPAPAPEAPAGSACDLACRAFGSMQRSAARICAIAGESDERCRRARSRVADASARISGAECLCQNEE